MYAVGTSHPLSKRSFNWMALPRVSLSHGVKYYNLLIEVSSFKFQEERGKRKEERRTQLRINKF
jgi:hypothetical protein